MCACGDHFGQRWDFIFHGGDVGATIAWGRRIRSQKACEDRRGCRPCCGSSGEEASIVLQSCRLFAVGGRTPDAGGIKLCVLRFPSTLYGTSLWSRTICILCNSPCVHILLPAHGSSLALLVRLCLVAKVFPLSGGRSRESDWNMES